MSRIAIPTRQDVPPDSQPALDALDAQLGFVPNSFRVMSLSPHVLIAYCALRTHIRKALDGPLRGKIALAVAQANGCAYSVSAHTYLAQRLHGLDSDEMILNRHGQSLDEKSQVVVGFVRRVIESRGLVTVDEIDAMRQAGFSDAEIVESVGIAMYYSFANVINNVAQTDIDFPLIPLDPEGLN